jgi:hypothetical protein
LEIGDLNAINDLIRQEKNSKMQKENSVYFRKTTTRESVSMGQMSKNVQLHSKFYSNLITQDCESRLQQFPQLHSKEKGHDADTCEKCRAATKYLLDLSNSEDFKWNQSLKKDYSLFDDSSLQLFSEDYLQKLLETSNKGFQYAVSPFSEDSKSPESRDESQIILSKDFHKEMAADKYKLQEETETKEQIASVKPAEKSLIDDKKPWKKLTSIDPTLSPRYDQVFPALNPVNLKQQIVHYNNPVSGKSRK